MPGAVRPADVRATTRATMTARLGAVRAVRERSQHRLGRSQPAVSRSGRRRPRRRPDHRDEVFTWYPSLGEEGFGRGRACAASRSTRKQVRRWSSPTARSPSTSPTCRGDGLTDLVRIRNGEVCYWPNLGYGRFGAQGHDGQCAVVRHARPVRSEAHPARRHRRLRHHRHHLPAAATASVLYFNQSGNGWSAAASRCAVFPRRTISRSVTTVDLLGNGTACLVWSSPLPGDARPPDALRRSDGRPEAAPAGRDVTTTSAPRPASTTRRRPSSTCRTERAGTPWITRLPFPVHVVERVETYDAHQPQPLRHPLRLSPRLLRRRRARVPRLRHGRAVGHRRVRRVRSDDPGRQHRCKPPRCRRCSRGPGFTPAPICRRRASAGCSKTSTTASPGWRRRNWTRCCCPTPCCLRATLRRRHELPGALSADEAARGLPRAQGRDAAPGDLCAGRNAAARRSPTPSPSELHDPAAAARRRQPPRGVLHPCARDHRLPLRAQRSTTSTAAARRSARHPRDDAGGRRLRQRAAIRRDRLRPPARPDRPAADRGRRSRKQKQTLADAHREPRTPMPSIDADAYRTPLPAEARTYELLKRRAAGERWPRRPICSDFDEMQALVQAAGDGAARHSVRRRRGARAHTGAGPYRRPDRAGAHALPRGRSQRRAAAWRRSQPLALPVESYKLAFTPGLLAVFERARSQPPDADGACSTGAAGRLSAISTATAGWWIPSGRVFFSPDPATSRPGVRASASFSCRRRAAIRSATSRVWRTTATICSSTQTDDAARQHRHRASRLPRAAAAPGHRPERQSHRGRLRRARHGRRHRRHGQGHEPDGRLKATRCNGFVADLTRCRSSTTSSTDPRGQAAALLGDATTRIVYDVRSRIPKIRRSPPSPPPLARETHVADLQPGQQSQDPGQLLVLRRLRPRDPEEDPGRAGAGGRRRRQSSTRAGSAAAGRSSTTRASRSGSTSRSSARRTTSSSRVQRGVSPILFYDPVERVVATLHPNHTYEKVVFDPWRQETWDVNDTVTLNPAADPDVGDLFGRLNPSEYSADLVRAAHRSGQRRAGGAALAGRAAAQRRERCRQQGRGARRHAGDCAFRRAGPNRS